MYALQRSIELVKSIFVENVQQLTGRYAQCSFNFERSDKPNHEHVGTRCCRVATGATTQRSTQLTITSITRR